MEKSRVISELNPKSPAAEAFRILRTNLQFSTVEKPFRTLLVTSAGPSEGKSTMVANLGMVMAQAGARVIIVDCDLRQGDQHRIFNLPNGIGLTDVLAGRTGLDRVLRDTREMKLKVVTSGSMPPNPAELLGSDKMREVLENLTGMVDIVLLDSPPALMVADASLLSSIVDGVVLIIKAGKTKIEAIRQAKERLNKANARIMGTVLNAVEGSNNYYNYDSKGKNEAATTRL